MENKSFLKILKTRRAELIGLILCHKSLLSKIIKGAKEANNNRGLRWSNSKRYRLRIVLCAKKESGGVREVDNGCLIAFGLLTKRERFHGLLSFA